MSSATRAKPVHRMQQCTGSICTNITKIGANILYARIWSSSIQCVPERAFACMRGLVGIGRDGSAPKTRRLMSPKMRLGQQPRISTGSAEDRRDVQGSQGVAKVHVRSNRDSSSESDSGGGGLLFLGLTTKEHEKGT